VGFEGILRFDSGEHRWARNISQSLFVAMAKRQAGNYQSFARTAISSSSASFSENNAEDAQAFTNGR
jgi:hypothetical protein